MKHEPEYIPIEDALGLLKSRGVPERVHALVQVLADDRFRARCLCDGQRGDIPPDWWRHIVWWPESGTIFESNTAYFDLRPTRRASQIEVDRRELDRRWPSPPRGPVPTKDSIKVAAWLSLASFGHEPCVNVSTPPAALAGWVLFLGGAALATISQGKSDPCRLPRTRFPARRLCGGRDETERQAVAPPR